MQMRGMGVRSTAVDVNNRECHSPETECRCVPRFVVVVACVGGQDMKGKIREAEIGSYLVIY